MPSTCSSAVPRRSPVDPDCDSLERIGCWAERRECARLALSHSASWWCSSWLRVSESLCSVQSWSSRLGSSRCPWCWSRTRWRRWPSGSESRRANPLLLRTQFALRTDRSRASTSFRSWSQAPGKMEQLLAVEEALGWPAQWLQQHSQVEQTLLLGRFVDSSVMLG